jgi:hypothetical protein
VKPIGVQKLATTSGTCTYGKYFVISVTDATNTGTTKSATDYCDPTGP